MSLNKPSGAKYKKMRIEKEEKEKEVIRSTPKIQTFFNQSHGLSFSYCCYSKRKFNRVLLFFGGKSHSEAENQGMCESDMQNASGVDEISYSVDTAMDLG